MSRSTPLSLDELLAKKKCLVVTEKPRVRFLTKSERQKLDTQHLQAKTRQPRNAVVKRVDDDPNTKKREAESDSDPESFTPLVDVSSHRNLFEVPHRKRRKQQLEGLKWSEKPLDRMDSRDWRIMAEDFDINMRGEKVGHPLRFWNESGLDSQLTSRIRQLKFDRPTPIQRASIPLGLKGRNLIGIAETGSGKTLAYALPVLNYTMKLPPLRDGEGPYALILVPTRELALQVAAVFDKFRSVAHVNVATLIGGHQYDEDESQMQDGAEIVIATPGRLIDSLQREILGLSRCFFVVFDEADRMIDLGFEDQVNQIMDKLPEPETNPFSRKGRTTMMFTATMPTPIKKLTTKYLKDAVTVTIGQIGDAVESVNQKAIQCLPEDEERLPILYKLLGRRMYRPPVIVFANYKKTCELVADNLRGKGFRPVVMHGSKSQDQREEAIAQLRAGKADILVATDVAGRGIDIPGVSLVVNYQMARSIEDYTHRIGRTGRAGHKGTAVTIWSPDMDRDVLYDLRKMIERSPSSKCPIDLAQNEYAIQRPGKDDDEEEDEEEDFGKW